jgi:hypothetical protein
MNQLTWDKIPEAIKEVAIANTPYDASDEVELMVANEIMDAMKPELEKAYEKGYKNGVSNATRVYGDFIETAKGETYYNETYGTAR